MHDMYFEQEYQGYSCIYGRELRKEREMRKAGWMFFSVFLILGLSGCGRKTEKYKEFITVDVYDEYANDQGLQSGWFAKVVKDRFNMELNIISAGTARGGETLYETRAAAGNLGDLIIVDTANGKVENMMKAGLLLDVRSYLEGTDLCKNYEEAIRNTNEQLTGQTEGMYVFPRDLSSHAATESSTMVNPTFGTYIRWDYYAKLSYPKMEDLDAFLDVLEQMQALARKEEQRDDIYAVSLFRAWDDNMLNNAKQIACMYGYDEVGFVLAKADGSDHQDILDPDSLYIRALRFFCEANRRGLLDPDSMTQDYDTWSAKYEQGKTLYCPWPWVAQSRYNTPEHKENGKGYMLAPVEDMQIFAYGFCPEGNTEEVIAIGSKAKDPQRLSDFLDWLYSSEGIELNGRANGAAGLKGVLWDVNEDGKAEFTEYGKKVLSGEEQEVPQEYGGGTWDGGNSALNFKAVSLGNIDPTTGEPYDYSYWQSILDESDSPMETDWKNHVKADTAIEYLEREDQLLVAPGCIYTTPEEENSITLMRKQCKDVILKYSWKMVFAKDQESFEKLEQKMREKAKGLGYEKVLEVDQKNADEQDAARRKSAEDYPEGSR